MRFFYEFQPAKLDFLARYFGAMSLAARRLADTLESFTASWTLSLCFDAFS
ncbi:hypothetical protein [Nitrobacter winogradskyi]|uniref:hypothetical protein n=1 Tax=Nitrobacter winogradskyi TaxID=913 RepID=UPI001AEE7CD4|nr:hypothetical protein [Nitrobacter winogradskyi]